MGLFTCDEPAQRFGHFTAEARRTPSWNNWHCEIRISKFDSMNSLENRQGGGPRSVLVGLLDSVIPAWSAGIQADMDVSGRILHTWMPAIHAGMTKLSIFMFCGRA